MKKTVLLVILIVSLSASFMAGIFLKILRYPMLSLLFFILSAFLFLIIFYKTFRRSQSEKKNN
jgi:membrane protein implicated in regulation of membrane protease activity